jgi:glycosyltransferase involved in cell wall biosynthesis
MTPRRIAMVAACPFPHPRGTPIRIHRMAEALVARGHDVQVVAYHLGGGAPASFPIHRIRRVPTYRRTAPGPTYQKLLLVDPLLALKLRELLRRQTFDVIHAHHHEGMLVALAARRSSIPVVFDVHTLLESELPYYRLGLVASVKRKIGRLLDRRLANRADHVIAVTDTIRSRLIERGAALPARVSVIPNGVECERFPQRPRPQANADGRVRRLIFTGNLAAYQGIELLLAAFRTLLDTRRDVRLVVMTEDSFAPYERLASGLGVREFIDVQPSSFDEIPALLAASDVALNPRTACDGLPQKLLNYLAAGIPVVSFAGSAKHIVTGEHGLVVADGDTAGFARAVGRLLDEPALAARLGSNGRELVRSELSWDATARKVEAVYEGLA